MSCTLALKSAGTECKIEKKARFKVLFSSRLGPKKIEASFLCTRLSSPVHPFVITARGGGNFCSLSGPSGSVLLRVLRLFIAPIFPRSAPISLIVSFLPSIPFRRNVFYIFQVASFQRSFSSRVYEGIRTFISASNKLDLLYISALPFPRSSLLWRNKSKAFELAGEKCAELFRKLFASLSLRSSRS